MMDRFDPFETEFIQNPYPLCASYRAAEPVHWGWHPRHEGSWYLFRYADVRRVLMDARFGRRPSQVKGTEPPELVPPRFHAFNRVVNQWLVFLDPPDHTRVRAVISRAFSGRLDQLRDRITQIARDLLDPVVPRGQMDLVTDFAMPFPIMVIAEILGVDAVDRRKFREWSFALLEASASRRIASQDTYSRAERATVELLAYFEDVITDRQANPREDLVSALAGTRHQQVPYLPTSFWPIACIFSRLAMRRRSI